MGLWLHNVDILPHDIYGTFCKVCRCWDLILAWWPRLLEKGLECQRSFLCLKNNGEMWQRSRKTAGNSIFGGVFSRVRLWRLLVSSGFLRFWQIRPPRQAGVCTSWVWYQTAACLTEAAVANTQVHKLMLVPVSWQPTQHIIARVCSSVAPADFDPELEGTAALTTPGNSKSKTYCRSVLHQQ